MHAQVTDIAQKMRYDAEHIWHPYASLHNAPPVQLAVSAKGTKVRLADGSELVDAVSSWWCMVHGHNHPAIVEAIQKQSEKLCHVMFGGFTHEPAIELAERLAAMLPPTLNKIFFADSGSISVECAAKMAVQYQHALGFPNKCKLVALKGGYHGDTAGAMALSDPDGMHTLFQGIMPKHYFAERPNCRFGETWRDDDFASMLAQLDAHAEEIAAVIVEPIFQGGNGLWLYHAEYLRKLRAECTKRGILLIFDEVATGFGRTGKPFAMQHGDALETGQTGDKKQALVPDILCIGKILSGGSISLAACVASDMVAETISRGTPSAFMHGPTYMANPLACAAACASLRILQENNCYHAEVARIEEHLRRELLPCAQHKNVRDVRILGAIGVLELAAMPRPEALLRIIREHGVWLRPFCNFVYTMPPFISSCDDMARITAAMKAAAECQDLLAPYSDDAGEFHE